MLQTLQDFFSSNSFMPHGHCYLWRPSLVWTQVISNGLIGLAYLAISSTLAYLVFRIRDIPFKWMYIAFGLFIVTCGFTHFMDIWTIWSPVYWTDGMIRVVTAVASVGTAFLLPPLMPKAIALAQGAKLAHDRGIKIETAYQELGRVFEKTKELDELKTQFFANVSHELRTPLALILGPADKMRSAANLTDDQRRDLEVMSRNAKVLLKHVNDLLDVAKLEAGKMVPHYAQSDMSAVVKLVSGNFDGIAQDRQISFAVNSPDSLIGQVDPDMIQRVLLNLLSNAFKFVPNHGRVSVNLSRKNSNMMLSVQDSGPGVPADQRDVIFQRFRQVEGGATRRFGGTGLGLSIVKQFVELHHGSVKVSDASGGGALFTVELPIKAPPGTEVRVGGGPATSEEATKQTIAALTEVTRRVESVLPTPLARRGTVLVVEDNPDMNRFIADALSSEYQVLTAFDGKQGLDKTLQAKPDLILSDVMMPEMSGDQMIAEIRKHHDLDDTPVVLLTAKADDELRIRMLREGAQDYVTKPCSSEEVLARVRNLVTMKRAREMLQRELASQIKDLEALAKEVTIRRKELQKTTADLRVAKEQAERASQVKTNFLGMVTHEVRTPMTSLQLQLQMLKRGGNLNPKQVELIDRIARSSGRSLALMESLLSYTRVQSGKLTPKPESFDLFVLVQEMIEPLRAQAAEKGLEIRVSKPVTALPPLRSDRTLVDVVVKNLLANAIKYTDQGYVEVAFGYEGDRHRVFVRDTGPGIPPEHRAAIFEPFEQLTPLKAKHKPGFGLGLSIARETVRTLGGDIELISAVGHGSTFTAVFPQLPEVKVSQDLPQTGT